MDSCCFPGCKIPVDRLHVACTNHWALLDAGKRGEVLKRLRGWGDRCLAREVARLAFLRMQRERGTK